MADKIKVALNGYGTIGKRVADAVSRQDDMTLVGIAKTKPDYEAYAANKKGYPIYAVEPAKSESKFKAVCPYASQFLVFGNERNYCIALITLDPDAIEGWAAENGLAGKSYTVLWCPSLRAGAWQKLADVQPQPVTQEVIVGDPLPLERDQRYYRLVTPRWP